MTEKKKFSLWTLDKWVVLTKKHVELTEDDRQKVASVYHAWQQEGYEDTYQDVPEFCYSASFDEVKEKGFTLVPNRYRRKYIRKFWEY